MKIENVYSVALTDFQPVWLGLLRLGLKVPGLGKKRMPEKVRGCHFCVTHLRTACTGVLAVKLGSFSESWRSPGCSALPKANGHNRPAGPAAVMMASKQDGKFSCVLAAGQ